MTKNPKTPLEITESTLGMLSLEELRELRKTVERLIVVKEGDAAWQERELTEAESTTLKRAGYVENKYINGYGPYAYVRWREDGVLRSKYLGKAKARS